MKKNLIMLLGWALLLLVLFYTYRLIDDDKERELDVIDEANGYVLLENASEYEKELFALLQIEKEEVEQAELIFKLFVANFFSLDLANSSSDVRGVQFIYKPFQDDFIKLAREATYERVENNYSGRRAQKLPIVVSVEIFEVEESSFLISETEIEHNSYIIKGELTYNEYQGYRKEITGELIENDGRLEMVRLEMVLFE